MIELTDAWKATARFGLGPRPGEAAAIGSDPRGYVLAQLAAAPAAVIPVPAVLSTDAILDEVIAGRTARGRTRRRMKEAGGEAAPMMLRLEVKMADQSFARLQREVYRDEIAMRFAKGITTSAPFVERLVLFWSNHFTVAGQQFLNSLTGVYERETIRPHVLGRFTDMLRAAALHPAMLAYLDNHRSVGPDSAFARKRRRARSGINENLARELLELHTLGVDGGYTQADVIELALALTGWAGRFPPPNRHVFDPELHQPGTRKILGRRYAEAGEQQIHAILHDLGRHPATARHIARKLARHFVADTASDELIGRLERTFLETDGDLGAVSRALADSDEAWAHPPAKVLPPYDFVVAVGRAAQQELEPDFLEKSMRLLGQRVWYAPSPAGWPDADGSWIGGDALMERLDWIELFLREHALPPRPGAFALGLLGGGLDGTVATALQRAESREQAYALLFMSPYWQRR